MNYYASFWMFVQKNIKTRYTQFILCDLFVKLGQEICKTNYVRIYLFYGRENLSLLVKIIVNIRI